MYREDRFDRVNEFIDFCEKQPAKKSYDWADAENCACGQFFGGGESWFEKNLAIIKDTGISLNALAGDAPWRFGPLAKRVRAMLEVA